jgi:biopolymer transport protein ExbD
MRNIDWIVLDDIKMNLVAALIVLVLTGSFNKIIDLPFSIDRARAQTENGAKVLTTTKILISNQNNQLMVNIGKNSFPLVHIKHGLDNINPALPVVIAVEMNSGLTYKDLLSILSVLRQKGIENVSLLAENS